MYRQRKKFDYPGLLNFPPDAFFYSRGAVSGLGRSTVYRCAESAIRIQREPLYIDGHLQRVPPHLLPQRVDVSLLLARRRNVYISHFVGRSFSFAILFLCSAAQWRYINIIVITFLHAGCQWWKASLDREGCLRLRLRQGFKLFRSRPPPVKELSICRGRLSEMR